MDNTIHLNYMTGTYQNFIKGYETKTGQGSFAAKISKRAEGVAGESGQAAVSTANMDMEEYKQYIYDEISRMPIHPSRMQDNFSIHISDAGFEAMKNDPEYEAWVLGDIRAGFMRENVLAGICGGSYCVSYYGATKEEYRGEMWSKNQGNARDARRYEKKAEKSFWEKRRKKRKELQELYDKQRYNKILYKQRVQKACADHIMIARKEKSSMTQSEAMKKAVSEVTPLYETQLLMDILNQNMGGF